MFLRNNVNYIGHFTLNGIGMIGVIGRMGIFFSSNLYHSDENEMNMFIRSVTYVDEQVQQYLNIM